MPVLRRVSFAILCLVLYVGLQCCWATAWAQTSVSGFSPEGQVRRVRQAVARFSAPMVAFGDLRAASPFDVDCGVPGSARWIDARTWSYDFERDLPGATACRFTLKPDAHDLAGQPLAGPRQFSVATGGPAVLQMLPREGMHGIDESQVFVFELSAPASADSILQHAWCRAEGINEKIGVRIIHGEPRLQALLQNRWMVGQIVAQDAGKSDPAPWKYSEARLRADDAAGKLRRLEVLQCQRPLPADTEVAVVWGAGVAAPNGVATAQDQALAYKTRPDFSARFICEKMNARANCIPFQPMRVQFSAPVKATDAAQVYLAGARGKRYPAQLGKGETGDNPVSSVSLPGPFPAQARLSLHLPDGLHDDAGRPLVNADRFPLAVRTGDEPPLVKFAAPFGIIEAHGDRLLPVTVRNVEPELAGRMHVDAAAMRLDGAHAGDVIAWMRKIAGSGEGWTPRQPSGHELEVSIFAKTRPEALQRFSLPKPNGRRAFEVIGIPLRQPGFYAIELQSPRLGSALNLKGRTAYVRSAALVTNMAAHFEHGAQSSLVWVTSLDKGQPVAGARVEVRDCAARLLWSGSTDRTGIARIKQALPPSRCKGMDDAYFISAARADDFTFTLSDWQQGIETWRFNLPIGSRTEDSRQAATVFDRTLLRAGETVHMKHFLRRRTGLGFAFVRASEAAPTQVQDWRAQPMGPDKNALPAKGFLIHQGTGEKLEFPLQWDANGGAESEWTIPHDAKLGAYDVMIAGQVAGEFRVEQFRVPTMKAVLAGPALPVVAPQALTLDAQVSYLAGGPAALAPVKLRSVVQDTGITFPGYEDYMLGNGDVREGAVRREGGTEDEDEGEDQGEDGDAGQGSENVARTQSLQLDRAGGARIVIDKLPAIERPKSLLAELSYQDANGETLTTSARVALWPSAYVVGIKPDGWLLTRDALKFQAVVLDLSGKPAAGVPVTVDFLKRVTYSHRRRLVGGFYAYENSSEIKRIGEACSGTTDARGLLLCDVKAPTDGDMILRAHASDPQQRMAASYREIWVAGDDQQWFATTDNDRIDLLPAQKRYEPGETARFQVRSPFRHATVLVTVDREGILDTYVRHLSGREQEISVPIKASYAPNVFVSALVVRGRVAGVQPTALVDLGKPAYKLGIAPIQVGWGGHELHVDVAADRPVYKVRDQAHVHVHVRAPEGTRLAPGAEVAVAAVDAGLLELMPNTSWNLLETMMRARSLQVETATAQMQVVGKRHFGRKAFPHGGGGGRSAGRELFETLLLWKGKVTLDANGDASVDVPLNDSLTTFRIVAVASSGPGLFGTGSTDIRSTQDLMLMSGLPPVVREGDRLRAGFTLRNASDHAMNVQLDASMAADGRQGQSLSRQQVELAPGQSREVGWDVQAPVGSDKLQWDVQASAAGASDRIKVSQQLATAVPVRTLQSTLVQLDGEQVLPVERPSDALPGRGGIRTTLQARLGGALPGVHDYMAAYPYSCFEQRTSRAVALRDRAMWDKVVATLPAHLDNDGLVKYFAPMEEGSDVLTAYVLSLTDAAGYAIPDELKSRMLAGLVGFVEGRVVRGGVRATGDLAVRKLAALEALSRAGLVRPPMLDSIEIQPNLWPTSALLDWYQILKRAPGLPQRDARLARADQILRARLNLQGTTMGFSTEARDNWWWLMTSADENANRLLLATLDDPAWREDAGRLARGTLGRQHEGHWDTTTANAWGVVALDHFSQTYEREPVTGKASVSLSAAGTQAENWSGPIPADQPVSVLQAWPRGRANLTLRQLGGGKPWATIQSLAAVPLTAPLSSGYRIVRTVTPVERKSAGVWSRGDIYRVHLDIDAQSEMSWVVVDDPIPAGASVLGSGLGGDSQIATRGQRQGGWVWPAFQERSFTGFRSYYEWVPKGRFSVEYTVRLNNEGRFALPPTRVEAMYAPEMFGELPNAGVVVGK
jgi:uncharacterized protein YfaS (alpha-2-macroglobulin family)